MHGPTPGQARGRAWRRVAWGWYVPATVDGTPAVQRIVEAAVGTPGHSAVTGWAALHWLGARWFTGLGPGGELLPVPLALHHNRYVAPRIGSVLSEDWLFQDDVWELDGVRVTVPVRSVSYEARQARTLTRAVQAIDMAAADDLVSLDELRRYGRGLVARPGIRRFRHALALAEENVWSPMETVMRLLWSETVQGRRLMCNQPLFDHDGRHLLTPDLFDAEAGVAGEYDGEVHMVGRARRRDLERESTYRDLEIETVTMVSGDARDPEKFRSRLRRAYARAGQPSATPRWTTQQPPWWRDTSSVAKRRALSKAERDTWLGRPGA